MSERKHRKREKRLPDEERQPDQQTEDVCSMFGEQERAGDQS